VDSLGWHLNLHETEEPIYLTGTLDLYKGKGTDLTGDDYIYMEPYTMNWSYNDHCYVGDIEGFDANNYNKDNFYISELPLSNGKASVYGEIFTHHIININTDPNIIDPGLEDDFEFAYLFPNETSRIDFIDVARISQIGELYNYLESWQGYSFLPEDYVDYNPDSFNLHNFEPATNIISENDYELVIVNGTLYQINFYTTKSQVIDDIGEEIQIDFYLNYNFKQDNDYVILEEDRTYDSTLHWVFPPKERIFWNSLEWNDFAYHPALTSTTEFYMSYSKFTEYASKDEYKASVSDIFEFYPNMFNQTSFIFEGFTNDCYEVEINLTKYVSGYEEYPEFWDYVEPYSLFVLTESGERYLTSEYIKGWYNVSEGVYSFWLSRYMFERDNIEVIEGSEVMLLFTFREKQLEYILSNDDVLYSDGYVFEIKDSSGTPIEYIGDKMTLDGNIIIFNEIVYSYLDIGENFTVDYEIKFKGGLVESKNLIVEVMPWSMTLYNTMNVLSGGSLIAPFDYDLSSNRNYQIALNYRFQEKDDVSYEVKISNTHINNDQVQISLKDNIPIEDFDGEPILYAYVQKGPNTRLYLDFGYLQYDEGENILTITNLALNGIQEGHIIHVEVASGLHNKYQPFHNFKINLQTKKVVITDWSVQALKWGTIPDKDTYLIPDLSGNNFLYNVKDGEVMADGKVKTI